MAEPFVGEIRMFGFPYAPRGWALCNGQLLSIAQNQALYVLLGTQYGGNGVTTFGLPDLRGRVPVHVGNGIVQGQSAGTETVTLTVQELPAHTHVVTAYGKEGNTQSAPNDVWAASPSTYNAYAASPDTVMGPQAVSSAGGSQPHVNMQPYLVGNYCIALVGIFPSQS